MKIIIAFICLIISFNANCQTTFLEDYTWYLEKLSINNDDVFPPTGYVVTKAVTLNNNNTSAFIIEACWNMIGNIDDNKNEQSFIVLNASIADNDGCDNTFDEALFYTFYEWQLSFPNSFTYAFSNPQNNLIILTITNANGDQAIYRNQELSVNNIQKTNVSLFPNPANEYFTLEGGENEIQKIIIYNLVGKEIKTFRAQENYHINELSNGIYFVKITDVFHREIIQKMIKK